MEAADDDHYFVIVEKLARGQMIPFLGAGANLCDRGDQTWTEESDFLPSGYELAVYLAQHGRYPRPEDPNLLRVSQYLHAKWGEGQLYHYLREVFARQYEPTSLHRLLARIARQLSEAGLPQLVVVTTNYDDLVERAFDNEKLDYDVVWYEARDNSSARGRFVHRPPNAEPKPIAKPNEYTGLPPLELKQPAILKLHGCLVRASGDEDSYVITEDSYIDYLSFGDVGALIPIALWQRLTSSSLLFLGYSLSDWNLRVILNKIWGSRKLVENSWAVQREPTDPKVSKIEQTLWDKRPNVELVYCELSEYVREIDAKLAPPAKKVAQGAG